MEYKEWRFVDKTEWSEGEWQHEPDKIQFVDTQTKLPCLIVRGPSGALCGYVGVSKGHKFYGKHYDDIYTELTVTVHGGLTYSGFCQKGEHSICHVVDEGEDDEVWWLGFDCAHGDDYAPGSLYRGNGVYKNVAYVTAEIEMLAGALV